MTPDTPNGKILVSSMPHCNLSTTLGYVREIIVAYEPKASGRISYLTQTIVARALKQGVEEMEYVCANGYMMTLTKRNDTPSAIGSFFDINLYKGVV